MPVQARVIAQTRPPSSRASMPARATVTALASAGKIRSANNELPNKISSIRTRMHSAVRDRRNRNRDGARIRCNQVRRESSHSDESSAGGGSIRRQRHRQRFLSLPDDLWSLLSCGRFSAYRISAEGFSSASSFKSLKKFLAESVDSRHSSHLCGGWSL